MAFGSGREDYKNMAPVERSGGDLQNRKPVLDGPGRDTYIHEDGKRYFAMGREVSKTEYEEFMTKYEDLLKYQIGQKEEELRRAA